MKITHEEHSTTTESLLIYNRSILESSNRVSKVGDKFFFQGKEIPLDTSNVRKILDN